MIDVDNVISILKNDLKDKENLIDEIDKELEEMEKRKEMLIDKRSSANFYIDKMSKKIDIIVRAKKSEKPFKEIHPSLAVPEQQTFNPLIFGHTMMTITRYRRNFNEMS